MGANIVQRHDLESVAAVLCLEHGPDVHRVAAISVQLRDKFQAAFCAILGNQRIVRVSDLCLDRLDLAGAVCKVDHAFVPKLELTFKAVLLAVPIRNQICLPKRRVRLQAKLRGGHHRAEERLRRTLCQFRIRGKRGNRDPREPFRRHNGGKRFLDLTLHLLNILLHCRISAALCLHSRLRGCLLDFVHDSSSCFISVILNGRACTVL